MLGDRRIRLQPDGVTEFCFRFLQLVPLKSYPPFRNIKLCILIALVSSGEVAPCLDFGGPFLLLPASPPGPSLIGSALPRLTAPGASRRGAQGSHH